MEGNVVPCSDVWYFDGGNMQRPRCEHSALTVGMWSIVHQCQGHTEDAVSYLLSFFNATTGQWMSDDYPNELYFEQFLALFGAIVLSGQWVTTLPRHTQTVSLNTV
jgi:hypothetical protein